MTNAELIAIIRKPGKVSMPVLAADDVYNLFVKKADLIATLSKLNPKAEAPWAVFATSYLTIHLR